MAGGGDEGGAESDANADDNDDAEEDSSSDERTSSEDVDDDDENDDPDEISALHADEERVWSVTDGTRRKGNKKNANNKKTKEAAGGGGGGGSVGVGSGRAGNEDDVSGGGKAENGRRRKGDDGKRGDADKPRRTTRRGGTGRAPGGSAGRGEGEGGKHGGGGRSGRPPRGSKASGRGSNKGEAPPVEEEEEDRFDAGGYPVGVEGDDGRRGEGKGKNSGRRRQRRKNRSRRKESGEVDGEGDGNIDAAGNTRSGAHGAKSTEKDARGEREAQAAATTTDGDADKADPKGHNHCHHNNKNGKKPRNNKKPLFPPHLPLSTCLDRYLSTTASNLTVATGAAADTATSNSSPSGRGGGSGSIVRGKIRALPSKSGSAFVTCDRGYLTRDVFIEDSEGRNRALDGDVVFVELIGYVGEEEVVGVTATGPSTRAPSGVGSGSAGDDGGGGRDHEVDETAERLAKASLAVAEADGDGEAEEEDDGAAPPATTWADDEVQRSLWDPALSVPIRPRPAAGDGDEEEGEQRQYKGRVVHVCPPRAHPGAKSSELDPTNKRGRSNSNAKSKGGRGQDAVAVRTVVGPAKALPGGSRWLIEPRNKSLPRFMCPPKFRPVGVRGSGVNGGGGDGGNGGGFGATPAAGLIYRAEYRYGSWSAYDRWPPCFDVHPIGDPSSYVSSPDGEGKAISVSAIVERETEALLAENECDHGDFPPSVLRETEAAVQSGLFASPENQYSDVGWRPTPEMLRGRRDLRDYRIFTIDPTTAKDLDDALHIKPLPDGRIELGVHIADVSHFVKPDSAVDIEAARRATTVYLVDRTVPMLPRKLCEVACSLNENVERLAFSCIWRMNSDGTIENKRNGGKKAEKGGRKATKEGKGGRRSKKNKGSGGAGSVDDREDDYDVDVWYGRTVIKSCARLDYATAQNIIDGKVASKDGGRAHSSDDMNEDLWPQSRRPTGGHSVADVAADVRLMHRVAMARRRLRFENGALALNGVKMTFQLGSGGSGDGSGGDEDDNDKAPELAEPYPIRDSNRLVEEYMLLANYLVAQRLLERTGGLALVRMHPPPLQRGLANVVEIAREASGYLIDPSTSRSLQSSLSRLGRTCDDELVLQCITELLMIPMRPAQYIAAGEVDDELGWRHFALNIPYYTHFTSPIRRYADVIVHRLLEATLDDGGSAVADFPRTQKEIHEVAEHCNDKKLASKSAQDRSDRVFLSLFLRSHPERGSGLLGVVLSVGEKAFAVYVPGLGMSGTVYTEEHGDRFRCESHSTESESGEKKRTITMTRRDAAPVGVAGSGGAGCGWTRIDVKVFAKLKVSCRCRDGPPIDVSISVEGPWEEI